MAAWWIDYPGHASPATRHTDRVDIEFQIPQLSVTVLYLLYYLGARHVENDELSRACGLKYVVYSNVKVRDECVAYVIST